MTLFLPPALAQLLVYIRPAMPGKHHPTLGGKHPPTIDTYPRSGDFSRSFLLRLNTLTGQWGFVQKCRRSW
jgi:hypothetical protein